MGNGIVDVPGVEVFGKGKANFTLPCGVLDEQGKVWRNVTLREARGAEEDMMADDSVMRAERTTNVLVNCIETLGPWTDKEKIRQAVSDTLPVGKGMTTSDRIALMIFLRRTSVGDVYKFDRRCPCPRQHLCKDKNLDLRTIEMTTVPDERVGKRRVEVKLPRSGKKAILRVLTAKTEVALNALRLTDKDVLSAATLARLESVDGAALDDPRVALSVVKDLPIDDRVYLRSIVDVMEADVDTEVEVKCDYAGCSAEFSFALDVGQAFFSKPAGNGPPPAELKWL